MTQITYLQNIKRLTDIEYKSVVMKGKGWWGRDRLGVWGWHIQINIFKIDNQKGLIV